MNVRYQADADLNQAIEVVIEELLIIWSASSAEEWVDRIAKLPL